MGALITFTGYPSSGKSQRAAQLEEFFLHKIQTSSEPAIKKLKVVVLNDENLHISKSSYDDTKSEKPARATLFSAVTRALSPETLVIVDAMNYIKGSRYQMYCNAREVSSRNCTIFIATPPAQCREFNASKPVELQYIPETFENLVTRYEEPNPSARWDSPMFSVTNDDPLLFDQNYGSTTAEDIWKAVTSGDLKPATAATKIIQTAPTNYLTLLESTTTAVLTSLQQIQSLSPSSPVNALLKPATNPPTEAHVSLNKVITIPVGQRLRREYVKNCGHAGVELSVEGIVKGFAEFLECRIG